MSWLTRFLFDSQSATMIDGRYVGEPDQELVARNELKRLAAIDWLGDNWVCARPLGRLP